MQYWSPTGRFIDKCLANLIVMTYDMPLLDHPYQAPATLKLFERSSKPVITQQESLSFKWGRSGAADVSNGGLCRY